MSSVMVLGPRIIAESRSQTRRFAHNPHSRKAASKRHSSTLLNTLNSIKPVICVPNIRREKTKVR
jgi:hypothetical protein